MTTEKSYVNFRIREYKGGIVSEVCALLAQICAFKHAQYQFWQLDLHDAKTSVWHSDRENLQRGQDFTLRIHGPTNPTVKYLHDNILFILEDWVFFAAK